MQINKEHNNLCCHFMITRLKIEMKIENVTYFLPAALDLPLFCIFNPIYIFSYNVEI